MQKNPSLKELVEIMARLRAEDGCPWDREQTVHTIKDYLMEEAAEAAEAASREDWENLAEELGDVLFEVVFLSRLAEEEGKFDISTPIAIVAEKLIRRHPHVFGEEKVESAEEVLKNWHKIKAEERQKSKKHTSELDGIPRSLPPLLQAYRLSQRAAALGFDWNDSTGVVEKVREELDELAEAIEQNHDKSHIAEEIGDLLFTIANLARHLHIQPHDALLAANDKFRKRFKFIEEQVRKQGKSFHELNMEQLDKLWDESKQDDSSND